MGSYKIPQRKINANILAFPTVGYKTDPFSFVTLNIALNNIQ